MIIQKVLTQGVEMNRMSQRVCIRDERDEINKSELKHKHPHESQEEKWQKTDGHRKEKEK